MANSFKVEEVSAVRIAEETPGMWQDCFHEYQPFSRTCKYFNDFTEWVADAWTVTEVDAGAGATTQTLADARNGVLVLTSAQNEDDGCQAQLGGTGDGETVGESWAPEAGKNLWFEARIKMNDVTQQDMFVGLHIEDTAVIASKGTDFIGFRSDDGDALLDCECSASSVASSEAGVHTLVDDTWVTVGFKVTGTEKIEFYVNGDLVATQTTSIPTALMKLTLAQLTGEGAANSLSVDYVTVVQDR